MYHIGSIDVMNERSFILNYHIATGETVMGNLSAEEQQTVDNARAYYRECMADRIAVWAIAGHWFYRMP